MSAATAAGTVADALAAATDALAAAGCASPRLDAELLLGDALGCDRAGLAAHPDEAVEPAAGRRFGELVRRRLHREPVAYLLGRKAFRGIELAVDRRALIPRPETELLVEVAVELKPRNVLDFGTGSGAIALALVHELRDVSVTGVDTSAAAIALARENAEALGLSVDLRRVGAEGRYGDTQSPLDGKWDLLIANLPYVRDDEWDGLEPEITRWEPRDALVSGPTGLEAIELLLAKVVAGRAEVGAIALEVGAGQAPIVARLVARAGFGRRETRDDLAGVERVVVGAR